MSDPLSPEAFYRMMDVQRAGNGDEGLAVRFFHDAVKDEEASKGSPVPVFKNVLMCEIVTPGDRYSTICDQVKHMRPDPRKRFPMHYARFQQGETQQADGLPLKQWGLMDIATCRTFEALNVFTVQQLASLSDANCQNIRGSLLERQKAKDFLATAKGMSPVVEARAEADKVRGEMAVMAEANTALRRELDSLRALIEERTSPVTTDDKPQRRLRKVET